MLPVTTPSDNMQIFIVFPSYLILINFIIIYRPQLKGVSSNNPTATASKSLSETSLNNNGDSPTGAVPQVSNFKPYQNLPTTSASASTSTNQSQLQLGTIYSSSSNHSSMSNSNNSMSSPTNSSSSASNNSGSSNNWLSKTLFQFKEATNQVVQKAQKGVKSTTGSLTEASSSTSTSTSTQNSNTLIK